jgi:hypothetical protein
MRSRLHAVALRIQTMPAEGWVSFAVVTAAVLFVLSQIHPELLVTNTTPAGGDMGAHVWGPAYLRDHLLAEGRLTGWTPDWYAGFPAYQFYMVVPSLLILALDVVLPYGIAFKLVTVSGLLTLPVAAWAFGKLSGLRFPTPAMLAVATVPFLFDRGFTIYGGNIPSTLAGEFAFSISLSLAVLYLGVVARGLETGKHRAWAAVLLALCGLCHLIPAFFALAGTAVWFVLRPGRAQLKWLATTLPVGGLLAAFWVLPFYWQRHYLNDMGWEKLHTFNESLFIPSWTELTDHGVFFFRAFQTDYRWLLVFPLAGAVFAIARRSRAGVWLVAMTALFAVAFIFAPQGRLWNARLLPFYYLCLYLLGGYAIAEAGKLAARLFSADRSRPLRLVRLATPVFGLAFILVLVGLPMRTLPFGYTTDDGVYHWMGLKTKDDSFVDGWAQWNYSGYERKRPNASGGGYHEYRDVVTTMAGVGEEHGCGRAMWEYEKELDRYGTPMALMLLPHWTDGCIGSMEGLYFEASASTPFHFLNQSELSLNPSRAQRDLPYRSFDLDAGIEHLQLYGVRYYMAFSDRAVDEARSHPDLTEVAESGPWHVFQVADSELVTPLENQPAVVEGLDHGGREWLNPAVDWYQDRSQWDVPLAADGPDDWPRIAPGDDPPREAVEPVVVSNIDTGTDTISFDVDQIGSPVLVKASYFPNWEVSGAEGPYRVTPNLMVVVPTSEHVELSYGYVAIDYLAWFLTLLGLAGLVWLIRSRPVDVPPTEPEDTPAAEAEAEPPPASSVFGPEEQPDRDSSPVPVGAHDPP